LSLTYNIKFCSDDDLVWVDQEDCLTGDDCCALLSGALLTGADECGLFDCHNLAHHH